jgi:hypothetical protein
MPRMQIPEQAIRRACEALGDETGTDSATRELAGRILLAVIPSIRDYERARIAEVIRPGDLDELAAWVTKQAGTLGFDSARRLQLWARVLRATSGSPAAMLLEGLPT